MTDSFRPENWPEDWPRLITLVAAKRIKSSRIDRKMSAQQLSERCAELGVPIARSVLANLESGRRTSIALHEILVLSRALKVSPISLCFPLGDVEKFIPTPNESVDTWDCFKWFTGEAPFPGEPPSGLPREVIDTEDAQKYAFLRGFNDMGGLFRHHERYAEHVRSARNALDVDRARAAKFRDAEETRDLSERLLEMSQKSLRSAEYQLVELRRVMRDAGLAVLPPLGDLAYIEDEASADPLNTGK
ncbi:helix-turn-helix domain-containing protein [Streptomyces sp. NRRL F-5123]|uniref:helix-turn-helix domain-containing protein n=1 Tax=Streptomyces sp. NRRL F-5123 TaxID=1463856 RepID=UPI00131BEB55|nr:helix-turn-helix transcriptional regulator [Streptomyces sp. NRRL F-5123]